MDVQLEAVPTSEAKPQVTELFGKFFIDMNGPVGFETAEAAESALNAFQNGAAYQARIDAYNLAKGYEGKTAVARGNVIFDFLTFEG